MMRIQEQEARGDWIVIGCALMVVAFTASLGVWQMERLRWKEGLVAEIAARSRAAPVSYDDALALAGASRSEYLRVALRGRFIHEREMRLFAVEGGKPGWHLVTPLALADGRAVLVNRGFVPDALEEPATRPDTQTSGAAEIVGLLRVPESPSLFAPDRDVGRGRWYWRDIAGMAQAASGIGNVAGNVMIEQEAAPGASGWPRPGATRLELSNRHFEYAMTWFGLAATLFFVTLFFLRSRRAGTAAP